MSDHSIRRLKNQRFSLLANAIVLTASFIVLVNPAQAETFRAEVEASLTDYDLGDSESELSSKTLAGRYFLKPVDIDGKPRAEAAFLNHISDIHATVSESTVDNPYIDEINTTTKSIGMDIYIPNTFLYVAADYIDQEREDDTWSSDLGVYFDNLLITTTYQDDVDYDPNVGVKYVLPLEKNQTLAFSGGFLKGEDGNTYSIGADYYATYNTSVGVLYTDYDSSSVMIFNFKHFFSNGIYLSGTYSDAEADLSAITFLAGIQF